ncbi:hypothetical protein [Selenomonas ruminantium]|uniref:Uncharacterized protein n=1 Tax=Selenomonas ruminantium TaxID=971 RepID=A0A1H0S3H6_SELRU|nr:hypothetical protein [Selenomonas ruminantium]SDP35796.1 hypothetical protein SAMN05216366_11526 [Selenomonas ruminantium]
MFLDLIENVPNEQKGIFERIVSHKLPIILYGMGDISRRVTEKLNGKGIEVAAYAVDAPYRLNDSFMGKPVYDFAIIKKSPEKYVFVSAIGDASDGMPLKRFLEDDSIIHYTISKPDVDHEEITYEYLSDNREKFQRTYDWLSDEESKQTFVAYLNLKVSGNVLYNFNAPRAGRQYFNKTTQMFAGGGHS